MPQTQSVRSWGGRFDALALPIPEASTNNHSKLAQQPPAQETENPVPATTDEPIAPREPHDASVFVGSLPTNIDEAKLTRLLLEHISEHAEVKNLKVVRDFKGGVCAFVQCENASAATFLIHTLNSTAPKPFFGRVLRYERARAFRTLLVSYRTPIQNVPMNPDDNSNAPKELKPIQLDLPGAMQIWKSKDTKFFSLLYNMEAREFHRSSASSEPSVANTYLEPILFDANDVCKLASTFGPLESFEPHKVLELEQNNNVNSSEVKYPAPHDAPRISPMDTGCWEIKFTHRDDCVNALMNLRRVPHLTVTWSQTGSDQFSPQYNHRHHYNVASYPFHVQGPSNMNLSYNRPGWISPRSTANMLPLQKDGWSLVQPHSHHNSQFPPKNSVFVAGNLRELPRTSWTEHDFPPLSDGEAKEDRRHELGAWVEKPKAEAVKQPQFPIGPETNISESELQIESNHGSPVSTENALSENAQDLQDSQELDIPPTPDLDHTLSPVTPQTNDSHFPATPRGTNSQFPSLSSKDLHSKDSTHQFPEIVEKELDPTSIFVGGLDLQWDEAKVISIFSKYGRVIRVKLVHPVNQKTSFAFVTFSDNEASSRAVEQENNQVYDSRLMRVQIRECNHPNKRGWSQNRGRGRYAHQQYRGKDERPESVPLTDADSVQSPIFETASCPSLEKREDEETEEKLDERLSRLDTESTHNGPSQFEGRREWYGPVSATLTPPPSSLGSSASATAPSSLPMMMPYPAYYPPHANWMHSYPQYPYPMPYYPAYPSVFPQQAQTAFPSPAASEVNGLAPPVNNQWTAPGHGIYSPYVPYGAAYGYHPRPSAADGARQSLENNSQAPLAPTGFIQNEMGTLIAVYQPEALNEYMSTAQATLPWPQYTFPPSTVPGRNIPHHMPMRSPVVYPAPPHNHIYASSPNSPNNLNFRRPFPRKEFNNNSSNRPQNNQLRGQHRPPIQISPPDWSQWTTT